MRKWEFYVSRKFNYFIEWVQTICTQPKWQKEAFGFSFSLGNYLILNGDEYYSVRETKAYEKFLEEKYKKDKNFFTQFAQREIKLVSKAKSTEKFLKRQIPQLPKLSNEELSNIFKKFLNVHIKCFATAFVRPDAYLEKKVKKELASFLKDLRKRDIERLFRKIATYPKEGTGKLDYLEEPLNLLKIAWLIKRGNLSEKISMKNLPLNIRVKIEEHWQKYQWLKNPVGYPNLSISKKEILKRLKILLGTDVKAKIRHIVRERNKNEENFSHIIRKYNLPQKLKDLCKTLRKFIFLRTYTTEGADRLFYWARQSIFKEIAKRMALNDEDVMALTGEEIFNFLKKGKGVPQKTIKERKRIFAVVWKNGKAKIHFGKEAEVILRTYKKVIPRSQKEARLIDTIKGQSASFGVVKGRAKVLKSSKEISKVRKGDILVVSMTTPDYIAAMEKAGAFVTDEGGITCHAAIVAREMNKPCVIGTKMATKVLRDGDLVEVDAEKGIVKILEK